ncbi:Vga family ABC-F type ribosomal protection protein [Pseudogracilibacillus auburnensis]|uniref:Pleuromutilin/lincosamide/streptogramin A transport system ATP-binding/permease protein n=1 Tax=Pseudogracilibacillus auburnensis TaxID=1494959 RepID=A0A2V3VSE9_9BACI|nr:ABC-F type ribosomal protection protein [Pseudogracilibacillus auburnensis]PXW83771.1 pleuromutilin/lincosamide/streptogramin A transport system ATP-binding/permease protein [Pseudogracilibacillus auburnensis]
MILLEANDVQMMIKNRTLFEIEQLTIQSNDRIGLIGRNGTGKTTLLEVLAKKRIAMKGVINSAAKCELLPQLKKAKATKSGGEVTQEYINYYLSLKPDILLADEPTTNLDTENIEKLEKQLKRWEGAYVIVSHDRAFLDKLCTTIWELDHGKVTIFNGNYSSYLAQKELERKQHENAYEQYKTKKKQLEKALVLKEQKAQRATKKPKNVSQSEAKITGAKPYFAKKQKKLQQTAKAIESRLERLEKVEKIKDLPPIKMDLPNKDLLRGRIILRLHEVVAHINDQLLWKTDHMDIYAGDKIALIGNNGAGKTTFLKKILNEEEGITISPAVKLGYFSQNLDVLHTDKSILENVRSSSNHNETLIRTVLARLRFFHDDVYKKVAVLSGGERVKVAIAKLFVSDVNTLFLDEPTNFLDIEAVEALETLLSEYEGTVILVSHDRRFIEGIANRIFTMENGKISIFDGSYDAYKSEAPDLQEDDLLVLKTKLTEVLSRLSIDPTEALEKEFQKLLKQKNELEGKKG